MGYTTFSDTPMFAAMPLWGSATSPPVFFKTLETLWTQAAMLLPPLQHFSAAFSRARSTFSCRAIRKPAQQLGRKLDQFFLPKLVMD